MNVMDKTTLPIGQIKNNPNNPRLIKDDKFKKLVQSIKDFPEMLEAREIVVNKDHIILGGNMRFKAAKEAGLKEVPVKIVDWSEDKQRQFVIKDNVSGGEWDWDLLANEFDQDELDEWGLDTPDTWGEEAEIEEDEAPEVDESEPPKSKLGEIYQLGRHRVMCADSTVKENVEKLMDGNKADMVFTDPPYNVAFKGQNLSHTSKDGKRVEKYKGANTKHSEIINDDLDDFNGFITQVLVNLKELNPRSWYFTFCDLTLDQLLTPLRNTGFDWKSIIIWSKNQATLSGKDYKSRYEPIVYGCKDGAFYGERYKQEDVWEFQRTLKNDLHPTMKPIPLIAQAIQNSSPENGTVIDVFLGSGSTLIACEQTDRNCYGMELSESYVDVIRKRYHKFVTGNEEGWEDGTPAVRTQEASA